MKILIVNTYDTGGAANSCGRLHKGLLEIGISSSVLLRFKNRKWPNSFVFHESSKNNFRVKVINKVQRILKEFKPYSKRKKSKDPETIFIEKRNPQLEIFNFPNSKFDIRKSVLYQEADIVNLHWVADFLDFQTFFIENNKPVVWTLHDMNPFSGGEHYEEKILGINNEGYPIKREISEEEKKIETKNLKAKKDVISKFENITIVAPSQWLAEEARKSEVFKDLPVYCIPYGLDSKLYAPRNKIFSRELLNIPQDKKVFLFVADSITNNRKGFVFLKRALELLEDPNIILCAIGKENGELESIKNIIHLGVIEDERLMSIAYSAADVFVIPSLMDNLPNTVLESLMCGTPVIGFPVGGILDMIAHGKNGLIVKEISVQSLVETFKEFINIQDQFDSQKIRKTAVQLYDLDVQALEYKKLFTTILQK